MSWTGYDLEELYNVYGNQADVEESDKGIAKHQSLYKFLNWERESLSIR